MDELRERYYQWLIRKHGWGIAKMVKMVALFNGSLLLIGSCFLVVRACVRTSNEAPWDETLFLIGVPTLGAVASIFVIYLGKWNDPRDSF